MFDDIYGNEQAKGYIKTMVEKEAVASSMLFSGKEGIGKSLFAEAFAAILFSACDPANKKQHRSQLASGNHPDLHHYRPEGKSGIHSIETMRAFCEEVSLAPYFAPKKVFIIHEAHRMLTYSANALLKTYEEPAEDSIIILLSSRPELILPTVLSRCRHLRFHALSSSEIAAYLIKQFHCSEEAAKKISLQAHGSIGKAIELYRLGGVDPARDGMLQLLACGKKLPYHQLVTAVKEIAALVEKEKGVVEEKVQKELLHGVELIDLSAKQRQAIEKEVEGAAAVQQSQAGIHLFDEILYWYRDLQLLYSGGSSRHLYHQDQAEWLKKSAFSHEPPPLKQVQELVSDARLSLERSTGLTLCLENLLLKLTML